MGEGLAQGQVAANATFAATRVEIEPPTFWTEGTNLTTEPRRPARSRLLISMKDIICIFKAFKLLRKKRLSEKLLNVEKETTRGVIRKLACMCIRMYVCMQVKKLLLRKLGRLLYVYFKACKFLRKRASKKVSLNK